MARIFLPLIAIYALMFVAVIVLSLQTAEPWKDPRFGKLLPRVMFYPAILLTVVMLGFAGIARFIDFGFTWAIFVIVPAFLILVIGVISLALLMAGDVRKVLQKPTIIVIEKDN